MMTIPMNQNAANERAVHSVHALALREGVSFARIPYHVGHPYRPSHILLDGFGGRVMGAHASARKRNRFIFDKLRVFRDIEWLVLVCLPSSAADDPVIFKIPRSEWIHRASITIDLVECTYWPTWYSSYRWSPTTRQEVRQRQELDIEIWRIADELAAADPKLGLSSTSGRAAVG